VFEYGNWEKIATLVYSIPEGCAMGAMSMVVKALTQPFEVSEGGPSILSEVRQRIVSAGREKWFDSMMQGRKGALAQGFFDSYPRFLTSSDTASTQNRLNLRHRALIESNAALISGQRVLDLASHDGRWSLAANKAGAKYVLGIEAREHLVEGARDNMRAYGVADGQVEFWQGDLMVELDKIEPGSFDTVFSFGFFYHTIDHMPILRKIARIKPAAVIIDTWISSRPGNIVEIHEEGIDHESHAAFGDPGHPSRAIKGHLSRGALEAMLKAAGYPNFRYYNWRSSGVQRWDDMKAYYMGNRITVTATPGR